jgi:hypothetical protein
MIREGEGSSSERPSSTHGRGKPLHSMHEPDAAFAIHISFVALQGHSRWVCYVSEGRNFPPVILLKATIVSFVQ